jgi:NAD(P)-dependent dehydrogenase (short-subunit alcohol dehydrogenase family)
MGKLEGKIALITGGDHGIGLATAKEFVNQGAYVFTTDHRDPELAAALQDIGRNVACVRGDVSDPGYLDHLFGQIKREKGELDILVANAAGDEYPPFGKITQERYDSIINVHVKGLFFAVQRALPLLPDGASIILNTAIAANAKVASNSLYSVTKAAALSFARTWTTQLEDRWIRVNAVSSGTAATLGPNDPMAWVKAPEQPARSSSGSVRHSRRNTPDEIAKAVVSLLYDGSDVNGAELTAEGGVTRLKMLSNDLPPGMPASASPDEIAKAVVFLASDDSRRITGMELFVDGGMRQL